MKQIVVIGGPTASGKTTLAIRCALLLDTEIISADSRQCYTEMSIGTAKPEPQDLARVAHHFINSHSVKENVTAGIYEAYAEPIVNRLLATNESVVIVGGTGLYIRALLEGLDHFPPVPTTIRTELKLELEAGFAPQQLEELRIKDPVWYAKVDRNNPRRITRALEIIRTTGKPFSDFLLSKKKNWQGTTLRYFYTNPPRLQLYSTIDERVDQMVLSGLEKEVNDLLPWRSHPALQTVGYREFFNYFDGVDTLETCIDAIKLHSRNYAKRQWTWFRNQGDYIPIDPSNWNPEESILNSSK